MKCFAFVRTLFLPIAKQADEKKASNKGCDGFYICFCAHWMRQPADSKDTEEYKNVSAI